MAAGSVTAMGSLWLTGPAALALLIWLYLTFLHHGFWRCRERLDEAPLPLPSYPAIVALVPARDEAAVIGAALASLLEQDYPGSLTIILIDDQSSDGTAAIARTTAEKIASRHGLTVLAGSPPGPGWAGKLWALRQGLTAAGETQPGARFLWFSDADIAHAPDTLRRLVAKAEGERRDLVSLMARLSCEGFWERLLIPPFIYFFQKLYPFAAINDPASRQAGAAGGCMLLRRETLLRAGGLEAVRGALIDDCSLGRLIKQARDGDSQGVWVGLATRESRSLRGYDGLTELWAMVARSAYTQLRHSPLLLVGTLLGMVLTYLAAPVLVLSLPLHGNPVAAALALAAWILMGLTFLPTLRFFGLALWRAPLLPAAALLYSLMTFDSARRHWSGKGGAWKGRLQGSLDHGGSDR